MSGNTMLPIVIQKNKSKAPGYVYLIKYRRLKDRYKIGSTGGNINRRLSCFWNIDGEYDLILYGFTYNRRKVESIIQKILLEYSNWHKTQELILDSGCNSIYFSFDEERKLFIGPPTSREYFIIKDEIMPAVFTVFNSFCTGIHQRQGGV